MLGELPVKPAMPIAKILQTLAQRLAVSGLGRGAQAFKSRSLARVHAVTDLFMERIEGLANPRCVLVFAIVHHGRISLSKQFREIRQGVEDRVGDDRGALEI